MHLTFFDPAAETVEPGSKGRLFESFTGRIAASAGYKNISFRSKRNGLEYDLSGTSSLHGARLLGEAKAHGRPISGKELAAFVGKLLPHGTSESIHGLFVSTSDFTAEAADYLGEVRDMLRNPAFRVELRTMAGPEVPRFLSESGDYASEALLTRRVQDDTGKELCQSWLVVGPDADFFVCSVGETAAVGPSTFALYRADGTPLRMEQADQLRRLRLQVPELAELEPHHGALTTTATRRAGRRTTRAALTEYLTAYKRQCGFIYPQRLPRDQRAQDIAVPLSDVYLSLALGPDNGDAVRMEHELTVDDGNGTLHWTEDVDLRSVGDLVARHRWSVVLGGPGSGKTTTLQWLALQHAEALLAGRDRVRVSPKAIGSSAGPQLDLGPARLPVLVSLGDYGMTARTGDGRAYAGHGAVELRPLRDFIACHRVAGRALPLQPQEVDGLLGAWLDGAGVMLLLDGLDEVRDQRVVEAVSAQVSEFCREHVVDPAEPDAFDGLMEELDNGSWRPIMPSSLVETGGSQVVVTSREAGYGRAPLRGSFTIVKAQDLNDADVERFAHHWCLAVERWQAARVPGISHEDVVARARETSAELTRAIVTNPGLARMARNPLLLTVLALVQREQGRILPTRFALFDELATVLVSRRTREWTYDQTVDVLGPLALWMQEHGRRTAHVSEVKRELRTALVERYVPEEDVDRHVEDFLMSVKEQTGLLVETSLDYYGFFAHNVFREFLASIEITRDPQTFVPWAREHLDDPHWGEVLLLGIASIGARHPTVIDEVLLSILETPVQADDAYRGEQGDVLHGRRLRAAEALLEMDRGKPETVGTIVSELVQAGSLQRRAQVRRLSEALERAVARLLQSDVRSRQVAPVLVALLADDDYAAFVCDVLLRTSYASLEMLHAIDAACARSRSSTSAPAARAQMATRLRDRGAAIDPAFARFEDFADELAEALPGLPTLVAFVQRRGHWVDPPIYHFLRYLETTQESSEERALERLFSLLRDAKGDAFDSLARVGRALDEDRVNAWILEQSGRDGVDAESVGRHLATLRSPLLPEDLSDAVLMALFSEPPAAPLPLMPLAWRALERGSEVAPLAWQWLARCATAFGPLPLSSDALAAVGALFDDPEGCVRGTLLLARLQYFESYSEPCLARLRALLDEHDDVVLATGVAIILCAIPAEGVSVRQLSLIADVLAAERDPLRGAALRALPVPRVADGVPDEVLQAARRFADRFKNEGDAAAAFAMTSFAESLVHTSPERVVRWAREGMPWGPGFIRPEAVDAAIRAADESRTEAEAGALVDGCLRGLGLRWPEEGVPLDAEAMLRIVRRLARETQRQHAVELFMRHAVRTARWKDLLGFAGSLAETDGDVLADAVRAAVWYLLPAQQTETLEQLAAVVAGASAPAKRPWASAAALMSVDAATLPGPECVLDRLAARTASLSEAAHALLHGVTASNAWEDGADLDERLTLVAERFAGTPTGMRALLDVCSEAIGEDEHDGWHARRGAAYLMLAVARAHPGLFVAHAPADLRQRLVTACRDADSFSVRRLAFALVMQFPEFDAETIALVKHATQDDVVVSSSVSWHLRYRSSVDAVHSELIVAIEDLLYASSERTILAATVLLVELGRRAPGNAEGKALRSRARDAIVRRLTAADPLLKIGSGRGQMNLEETLTESLMDLSEESNDTDVAVLPRRWNVATLRVRSSHSLLDVLELTEGSDMAPAPYRVFALGGLTDEQAALLNSAACLLLEMRVGERLHRVMRTDLRSELESLMHVASRTDAERFLEAARPDYTVIAHTERRQLMEQVKKDERAIRERLRVLRPADDPDSA